MTEKKYVVPEGMLKAVHDASRGFKERLPEGYYFAPLLEAALRWLSEHPIVPTDKQIDELLALWNDEYGNHVTFGEATKRISAEWQRRMFLAPPMKCSVCGVDVSDPLTPSMHYSAAGTVMRGHDDVANQPSKHTDGIPLELCGLEPTTWPTYGGITRGSTEPSVPEEIKHLMWSNRIFGPGNTPDEDRIVQHDSDVLEAFLSGQKMSFR